MSHHDFQDVAARIETLIRCTLDLGDDVPLAPDSDLIDEVGLDSIEGFEAISALHSLLEQPIPRDLDPAAIRSIRGMAVYVVGRFDCKVVDRFMTLDIRASVASLRSADELE